MPNAQSARPRPTTAWSSRDKNPPPPHRPHNVHYATKANAGGKNARASLGKLTSQQPSPHDLRRIMWSRSVAHAPADPLPIILESANPAHLIALAKYHEQLARVLHSAARIVAHRRHNAVVGFSDREIARREFLKIGARLCVLIRRGVRTPEAINQLRARGVKLGTDQMRAALRAWRAAVKARGSRVAATSARPAMLLSPRS